MGRMHRSRRPLLFLPILVLLGSVTVLFGAREAVRISSPAHKARVSGTIEVTAEVTTSAPVAYVLLVVDGTRPAATNSLPATFQLDTRDLSDGPHVVFAEVYTSRDMIAASKAITIYVANQTAPRVVVKQQSAPRTVTVASAPIAQSIAMAAPAASTDQTAKRAATVHGPVPEPTLAGSLEAIASEDSDTANAADQVLSRRPATILLNGQPLVASVAPTVIEGRMHSGFRALFAATGARIEWLAEQRTARCATDLLVVEVPIGSRVAMVNGRHVDMGSVATIENGRTVVPLQFFAQVTGSRVSWDARTRVASVQTPSRAMASAQASVTPAASMQTSVSDGVGMRTPIYEVAGRAP